ncbi:MULTISPECIES: non-heme iron oxygenase ferredoxin subunit [Rhodoluna]|jgi:3-phenylpropionate/trans-cinnamate dioxygenase ferredoxin component|uniref:non-heme iron oxygenase ferredoxin subunit n=1 Tax=Rhodoluna TaxID=529883 RepID=UPI001C12B3B2|nr:MULTISPECIES: non-heme iron oxygenase ferredoxin subunit [Rhodoluna]BDS48985.1 3-phenylpropionate/cinnamic acid dioxygenase ferredoxin subunit [Rhodoluna sp. KAS3]
MAVRICKVDEIKAGKAIRVKVGELQIAIFKTKDGEVFALDDKCSHGEISLSEGFIGKDKTVECWAHGAKFSLETGEALTLPAYEPVVAYEVIVENDEIFLEIDAE